MSSVAPINSGATTCTERSKNERRRRRGMGFGPCTQPFVAAEAGPRPRQRSECPFARARTALNGDASPSGFQLSPVIPKRGNACDLAGGGRQDARPKNNLL